MIKSWTFASIQSVVMPAFTRECPKSRVFLARMPTYLIVSISFLSLTYISFWNFDSCSFLGIEVQQQSGLGMSSGMGLFLETTPGRRGPVNLNPEFFLACCSALEIWQSLWTGHVALKQSWLQKNEGSRSICWQTGHCILAGFPQPGVQHFFYLLSIMLIFIIINYRAYFNNAMDFGQFELEQTQKKPTLKELQKIYSKNQKRRSELEEINNHNKHMFETETASSQYHSLKNAPTLQNHNLLNQQEKSFKTVPKLFSQLSILIHVLSIIMIVLLKSETSVLKILLCFAQVPAISLVVLHYYKKMATKIMHKRSNLILLEIACLLIADLTIIGLIIFSEQVSVVVGSLLGVDIILLLQLAKMYKIQKIMDAEVASQKMQYSQLD